MKKMSLNFIFMLFVVKVFSQATFLGFDRKQCGLVENPGYTYSNIQGLCSSHSAVYKIFFDGNLVYEKQCSYLNFYSVDTLVFINDSTGFLIERNPYGYAVYKTNDYGRSWTGLGGEGPSLLGFYVVNEHDVYLITTANGWGAIITKASDINGKGNFDYYQEVNIIDNEAIINDTIYGDIFCDIDTLGFKVKKGADTISYKIAFQNEPLPTESRYLSEPQLKIYPNPCSNYICFTHNLLENVAIECTLYTIDGRLLKSSKTFDNRMFVGDINRGIYLLVIKIGDKEIKKRIVKE